METKLKIAGNYKELKAKLKQSFPKLTDADLNFKAGHESELINRIAKKLGKTKMEVMILLDALQGSQKNNLSKKESIQCVNIHSDIGQEEDEFVRMDDEET